MLEISDDREFLTTQHSTQNEEPSQSTMTLGAGTERTKHAQRAAETQNGGNRTKAATGRQPGSKSAEKQKLDYRPDDCSSGEGRDSMLGKLRASFDPS